MNDAEFRRRAHALLAEMDNDRDAIHAIGSDYISEIERLVGEGATNPTRVRHVPTGVVFAVTNRRGSIIEGTTDGGLYSSAEIGECALLTGDMPEPVGSDVTESLVRELRERDAIGRAKYGTTLDRKDLAFDEWMRHLLEELLDASGYVQAARREMARPTSDGELAALRELLAAAPSCHPAHESSDAYKRYAAALAAAKAAA